MKKQKPFSDNVIFLDTEFSSLDPYKGEILSIGLAKINGEELYLELEFDGEADAWQKKHILPTLNEKKYSRQKAKEKIREFIGEKKPYAVAYVNQFDMIYSYKLFGIDEHPFYWLPIDFASFLFFQGVDPEVICNSDKQFFNEIEIDSKHTHHALDDARKLRAIYLKLIYGKEE